MRDGIHLATDIYLPAYQRGVVAGGTASVDEVVPVEGHPVTAMSTAAQSATNGTLRYLKLIDLAMVPPGSLGRLPALRTAPVTPMPRRL